MTDELKSRLSDLFIHPSTHQQYIGCVCKVNCSCICLLGMFVFDLLITYVDNEGFEMSVCTLFVVDINFCDGLKRQ